MNTCGASSSSPATDDEPSVKHTVLTGERPTTSRRAAYQPTSRLHRYERAGRYRALAPTRAGGSERPACSAQCRRIGMGRVSHLPGVRWQCCRIHRSAGMRHRPTSVSGVPDAQAHLQDRRRRRRGGIGGRVPRHRPKPARRARLRVRRRVHRPPRQRSWDSSCPRHAAR